MSRIIFRGRLAEDDGAEPRDGTARGWVGKEGRHVEARMEQSMSRPTKPDEAKAPD